MCVFGASDAGGMFTSANRSRAEVQFCSLHLSLKLNIQFKPSSAACIWLCDIPALLLVSFWSHIPATIILYHPPNPPTPHPYFFWVTRHRWYLVPTPAALSGWVWFCSQQPGRPEARQHGPFWGHAGVNWSLANGGGDWIMICFTSKSAAELLFVWKMLRFVSTDLQVCIWIKKTA